MSSIHSHQEIFETLGKLLQEKYVSPPVDLSFPPDHPKPIRENLSSFDFCQPKALKDVLLSTSNLLKQGCLDTSHPGYFGLFNGPAHLSSVVADALVAAYNPQLSAWSHGAAANEIELHVIKFFLKEFGLNSQIGCGHFTSGGSESNTTAILCALNKQFPNFKTEGLVSRGPRPLLYISDYAHHSFQKTTSSVGLGMNSIRIVPCDSQTRMDANRLREMIDRDTKETGLLPFCVVGTVGTTSTGVIDPLNEIGEICKSNGLWFHVDGAWGGAAVFSKQLKPLLDGIQRANSITFDAHKWMSVSMGAGLFLCSERKGVEETFGVHADYMPDSVLDTVDAHRTSLQWSRRFIGLKVFFALAEKGIAGFEKQINEQKQTGEFLHEKLRERNWIVVNTTPLPVICFTHPLIREGRVSVKDVLKSIYETRAFWISETKIKKESVFRACITHPQTTRTHIEKLVQELDRILDSLR